MLFILIKLLPQTRYRKLVCIDPCLTCLPSINDNLIFNLEITGKESSQDYQTGKKIRMGSPRTFLNSIIFKSDQHIVIHFTNLTRQLRTNERNTDIPLHTEKGKHPLLIIIYSWLYLISGGFFWFSQCPITLGNIRVSGFWRHI